MARRKLSVRDAAQVLGERLDSLYALIWGGKIPAGKKDGRWRIAAAAIDHMDRASELVLGFAMRTDAKIFKYPDRFMDPRGFSTTGLGP